MSWKITAIIFIILFIFETGLFVWGYSITIKEEKQIKECYYEICENNVYADLKEGVCFCYDYDLLGNLILNRTKVMG